MRPLAITGVGVVSPLGIGDAAWRASLAAPDEARLRAFGEPTVLSKEKCAGARAAEVWGFEATKYLGDKGLRNFDRLTKFLIVAARHALEDAGLKKDGAFVALRPEAVGIVSSTAYGSLDAITELNLVAELEDPRYINPARFPNTVVNAAAGYVSIWEELRAPNVTIVDGNCGALDAVITSETHLAHKRGEVFLVGGGEVLSDPLYLGFRKLEALAEGEGEWKPGDPTSRGMRLGEGASFVVTEQPDAAKARGARIRALILGYGTSFEPPESEALIVNASERAISTAVRTALSDARVEAKDVDCVCSSVGGIPQIDAPELAALASVLPGVAVAAPKMLTGETFGAHGAFGIAAALAWMDGVAVAPLVRGDRAPRDVRTVVVTAIGYYGNASVVVLRRG